MYCPKGWTASCGPTTGAGFVAIAKHGLRQWLRLHILAPELLVLPSRAVFMLWHDFVGSNDFNDFAKHAYGHVLARYAEPGALRARRPRRTWRDWRSPLPWLVSTKVVRLSTHRACPPCSGWMMLLRLGRPALGAQLWPQYL